MIIMYWVGCYTRRQFKSALALATRLGLSTIIEKDDELNILRIFDVDSGKWLETEEDFVATADRFGRL